MPINLYSPIWKESFKYLGWILLFIFLYFKGCTDNNKSVASVKVNIPEQKWSFEFKKPLHIPLEKTIEKHIENGKTIFVENPINNKLIAENEKLKSDYEKANDSIKKISFDKAIQLNKFSTKFEDDNLVLNINGIVQGEVKEITPNYIIKEKKVDVQVKPKETVFRLLAGLELGNNKQLDGFKVKANLMMQNRKGNIISGSFDTNQTIWVGYNVSIFNIKK